MPVWAFLMEINMKIKNDIAMGALRKRIKEYDELVKISSIAETVYQRERKRKKPTGFKIIRKILDHYKEQGNPFGRKQAKLLRQLDSLKPVSREKLLRDIGTEDLKTLVRDTKRAIKKRGGDKSTKIVSFKRKGTWFYQLKIPLMSQQIT